ncbi:hypothetical protein FB567DRAFT_82510 [Paraphoma chrysanthemicola]|uniref:Uncharacterized protein n=1 Tax=Paraphoma chrysanthemicola TaxID=798071 RepID=A0A8K0VWV0_9PLEO|nr:hypothetical protein FB567DRAFT_82510 [Paraphoma chrysanthemicola]
MHREIRTMGKSTVALRALPHGWHSLSLQGLSSTPIILPILGNQRDPPRPRKPIKIHVRPRRKATMGVALPAVGRTKSKSSTARETRERTSKHGLHRGKIAHDIRPIPPIPLRKRVGPGTRIGTLKEMPILIEDDDDNDNDDGYGIGVTAETNTFRNRYSTPSPAPSSESIYSPRPLNIPAVRVPPSRRSLLASARSRSNFHGLRQASADVGPAPPLPTSSPVYERTPDDSRHPSRPIAKSQTTREHIVSARSNPERITTDGPAKDMTLANIEDFDVRKKVADLMAVAPALPVQDLYDLLMDMEGDIVSARRHARRASEAPRGRGLIKAEVESVSAPVQRDCASACLSVADDDELMIKIDPNEAFLEWDSDTPTSQPALEWQSKAKKLSYDKHGKTKSKKSKSKAKIQLPKAPATAKAKISKASASRKSTSEKARPAITVNRVPVPPIQRRRQQDLSTKRQFAVPDPEVISSNSDMDDDSDVEMLDAAPDHMENLRIDMRPPWAYNEDVLRRERGRTGRR